MCDPITLMAGGSLLLKGAGALFGAQGDKEAAAARAQQLQAEQQADLYKSQVARNNEIIANRNAAVASDAGQQQLFQRGLIAGAQRGKTVAAQGANGLATGSGSNANVVSSEKYLTSLDSATIANNTAKAVYGSKVQGVNFEAEAQLDEMGASNAGTASQMALQAGDTAAMATILGGASSIGDKWLGYQQKGIF